MRIVLTICSVFLFQFVAFARQFYCVIVNIAISIEKSMYL